jgi:hypothetical protein
MPHLSRPCSTRSPASRWTCHALKGQHLLQLFQPSAIAPPLLIMRSVELNARFHIVRQHWPDTQSYIYQPHVKRRSRCAPNWSTLGCNFD